MEERTRSRGEWILALGAALVLACGCSFVAAGAMIKWFDPSPRLDGPKVRDWIQDTGGLVVSAQDGTSDRVEQSFHVGGSPELEIDNFAGSVTVRAVGGGDIHVIAIKRGGRESDREQTEVRFLKLDRGLRIETERPRGARNVSVELEITVPAGTRLGAQTGSGSMEVRGLHGEVRLDTGSGQVMVSEVRAPVDVHSGSGAVEIYDLGGDVVVDTGTGGVQIVDAHGEIRAHTGSGRMEVRGAMGRVQLDTGSGSITYQGRPKGDCRFETGSGSVDLLLPSRPNLNLDLDTGSGQIEVGFELNGRVQAGDRRVTGTVGQGGEGRLQVHTGSGHIRLSGSD